MTLKVEMIVGDLGFALRHVGFPPHQRGRTPLPASTKYIHKLLHWTRIDSKLITAWTTCPKGGSVSSLPLSDHQRS